MFVVNEDKSIYVTRGDTVFFLVTAEENGENYIFKAGDVVRFKVFGKKDCENVVLQKDFPVTQETENVQIVLTEQDTKIGEVISKPTDYWYEVELNPFTNPQTIIGYDDDGAKIFKLYPEGKDVPEFEPDPEDLRVIDTELDSTSTRPVQNQAIARAMTVLKGDFAKTRDQGNATAKEIEVERARIDNLVSGATADGAEVVDIRVGADGVTYASAGTAVRAQFNAIKSAFAEVYCNVIDESAPDMIVGGYYEKTTSADLEQHPDCAGVRWIVSADFNQSGLIPTKAGDRIFNTTRQPNNANAWGVPCLYYNADKQLVYMRNSGNALYKCTADGCELISYNDGTIYKETPNYDEIAYLSVPYSIATPSYTFAYRNGQLGKLLPYNVPVITAGTLGNFGENQWAGKLWYAYGTSLTSVAQGKYIPTVAEKLGLSYVNKGIPGGGLVANTQVYDALMDLTDGKTEADLITIEVGANDGSKPLGTPTSLDTSTICGALNTCLKRILKYCDAQIVVMCSTASRYTVDDNTAYELNTEYSGGYTVFERNLAIEQCAKANNVYFAPLGHGMGLYRTQNVNNEYLVDNIHMSEIGGYNTAMALIEFLKNVPNWYTSIPTM